MSIKRILDLEKRREIYNIILKNPGLHLNEIKRRTNIPKSTFLYHIHYLEKQNLIEKNIEYRYARYYVTNKISSYDKKLLNIIRQKIPRRIIFLIYWYLARSEKDIVLALDKHQTTINYHLKKLIDSNIIEIAPYKNGAIHRKTGIIERKRLSNEIFYILKEYNQVYNFFIKYKDSLKDDEIIDYFLTMGKYRVNKNASFSKIKKLSNDKIDSYCDQVIEFIYDVFPHPYHI
jgi:DNA-binding transcriptional ArsR family regulator